MKLETLVIAILFCCVTILAASGCGSSDTTTASGSGGSGQSSGSGGQSGGSGGAGGSSAGACVQTYKCQQAITPPSNDPTKLCAGTVAATKFDVLQACLCTGACASKCQASVCAQMMPSTACLTCLMDSTAGCGKETADCAAN